MKTTEIIKVEQLKVVSLTCNCCGKKFVKHEMNKVHSFVLAGSYSSDYPEDLTTVTFEACGDCLKTWTDTFKHGPESKNYLDF